MKRKKTKFVYSSDPHMKMAQLVRDGGPEKTMRQLRKELLFPFSHCKVCRWKPNKLTKKVLPKFTGLELHHVIPRARGGRDVVLNVMILCPTCHKIADQFSKHQMNDEYDWTISDLVDILRQVVQPRWCRKKPVEEDHSRQLHSRCVKVSSWRELAISELSSRPPV